MIFSLQTNGLITDLTWEQGFQLLAIGVGLVVLLLLDRFVVFGQLRRLFRVAGRVPLLDIFSEKDVIFSRWMGGLLSAFFITVAVLASLAVVGVDISGVTYWAQGAGLGFLGWLQDYGVRILLILLFGYLANRTVQAMLVPVIRGAVTRGKSGTDLDEASKRATALAHVARHTVRIVIGLVILLTVLALFEIPVAPLIGGLGVVGIAVGFGAQHTVRDIIAGAFIIGEDQYRVGDVVSVGTKTGLVEDLNLRRTVLRDLDGIVHYIPNGEISTASNFTKDFSRVNLDITVAYKEDLDKVIRILNRVGSEVSKDGYFGPLIIEAPRATRVNAFGDSGIDIKVLGVTKPIRQWEVAGELRRRIKREFDREGIEIPFPHRTIYWGQNAHPGVEPAKVDASRPVSQRRAGRITSHNGPEGDDASLATDPWVAEREAQEQADEAASTTALPAHHVDILDLLVSHPPSALFVDIDGTLARINPNPTAVSITSAVRQALNTLARYMTVVALTGRQVEAARNIVGLNSIIYVGNHGVEWWERGKTSVIPEAQPYIGRMADIARTAKRRLTKVDGLVIEDKGPSLSFHYRSAVDPESSRQAIERFLAGLREVRGLDIREGKMVVEVRPPVNVDKGSAVRKVVEEHGIASAIAMGDDVTDIDTFKAIGELQETKGLHGACVAVLGENTPPELVQRADYQARDVEDVELFLEWLAAEKAVARLR